ncbi:hypothetical protein STRIP9103_02115 [Streptomyces ipomoeae 91-03]|uniref:Uncharacterized protein n=1 Tax=Streptomyces ipomoeae 91-03 TaxID=698759 RepID=L1KQZ0_9ACTN|nr:hypothetical protein STRIP9103_02115 [Streptomyces ipomoeae 91-03]
MLARLRPLTERGTAVVPIAMLMADGGDKSSALVHDTVFAAVMITCNGSVGLPLPARRFTAHGLAVFNPEMHRCRPRHDRGPGHAQPDAPGRRPQGPVRAVRGDPDRAPPGLLPADHPARRGDHRKRPRRGAVGPQRRLVLLPETVAAPRTAAVCRPLTPSWPPPPRP